MAYLPAKRVSLKADPVHNEKWLQQVIAANSCSGDFYHGKRQASRYFFHYELPKIGAWLRVVETRDTTCADTPQEAF